MPRIVDHQERRQEIGEAAWRVIRREGLEAVSVRKVALEAGTSMGSLRHYFTSQSELLAFSMRMVVERVTARLEALNLSGDPRRHIQAVIAEVLPLDDERRAEGEVWLSFTSRALVDSALRELSDEVYDSLHGLMRRLIEGLVNHNLAASDLDIELEAERLQALIDGLVVHAISRPQRVSEALISEVVSRHIDDLLDSSRPRL
jgi:DNA-binding transcriptional regulator YbjK